MLFGIIYLKSKNGEVNNTAFCGIYLCVKIIKKGKEMINMKFQLAVPRGEAEDPEE